MQIVNQAEGTEGNNHSDSDIALEISDHENNESQIVDPEELKSGEFQSKKPGKKKGVIGSGGYGTLYK